MTVTVTDLQTEAPVEGVIVSATLTQSQTGTGTWNYTGTTAADGTVGFRLSGAGNTDSCYDLDVTSISGATWDESETDLLFNACRPSG